MRNERQVHAGGSDAVTHITGKLDKLILFLSYTSNRLSPSCSKNKSKKIKLSLCNVCRRLSDMNCTVMIWKVMSSKPR